MNRRLYLLSLAAATLMAGSINAQGDVLASAFAELSPAERHSAQEQLAAGGFYEGRIDGAYGPGTRAALMNAEVFIKDNSYGQANFDLSSSNSARLFLAALAGGELAKYLWGEGNECDGAAEC